jgi:hypothetical protein
MMRNRRPARSADLMLNPTLVTDVVYEVSRRGHGRLRGSLAGRDVVRLVWQAALDRMTPKQLHRLRAEHILVTSDEAPRPVRLELRLERLQAAAPRLQGRPGMTRRRLGWQLHPLVERTRAGGLPAALAGRAELAVLLPNEPLVWIEDPGSGNLTPYALGGRHGETLRALLDGRVAADELPPATWSLLARAGVLVPPGWAEQRRRQWRAFLAESAERLARDGVVALRGLFHPFFLAAVRRYFRAIEREGHLFRRDDQGDRRNVHNEPLGRWLHDQLLGAVTAVVRAQLKSSYCYLAIYQPRAALAPHVDRAQCEWNLSVLFDAKPELARREAWPIWVRVRDRARAIRLEVGDGVLYAGRRVEHWREPQPAGHTSTVCFFHFVDEQFAGELD